MYQRMTAQQQQSQRNELRALRLTSNPTTGAAMAIPGYGLAEQVLVGGFGNFLSIYNLVITGRILLSWFPQAQSVGALQPIYAITDPYLNLFRGLIPPIFGLVSLIRRYYSVLFFLFLFFSSFYLIHS
jgi:YggT family protein